MQNMDEGAQAKPLFAASLMCMDFLNIGKDIEILNQYCDLYHADMMDGHFCKNITLSPAFIRSVRKKAALPIDVHLMVTNPNDFLEELAKAGASCLSVHAETINADAFRTIRRIRSLGCKVGIVLNPATPLGYIEHYMSEIDLLTVMTVDVGYAGQPFIPEMLEKIRLAEKLKKERGYRYVIQTDGANNPDTYAALYRAGARCFVMGSTGLFKLDTDLAASCRKMKADFQAATGVPVHE